VFPGVTSSGHDLSIPMPGHSIDSDDKIEHRIEILKKLISEHDAIFLLTDSRESRWLPTVLGAAAKKVLQFAYF
jgi:ubiquitin-like modifier-activating enzyme ATG7